MTKDEQVSLYVSAASDAVDEITALLDAGLSPDVMVQLEDKPARPLLVAAAMNGARGVVKLLLARGADIDARDTAGMTALMGAAKCKQDATLQQLLLAGADRALTTPDGKTAHDLTRSQSIKAILAGEVELEDVADEEGEEDDDDDDGDGDGDEDGDDGDDGDGDGWPNYPKELTVAALEKFYDRALPAALRTFIETKAYEPYERRMFPVPAYSHEPVELRFADGDEHGPLVPELLLDAGDHDEDAAEDLIPLAAIFLGDDHKASEFLLVDASQPHCPVVMFEHGRGRFEPVADSLEAFLATAIQDGARA